MTASPLLLPTAWRRPLPHDLANSKITIVVSENHLYSKTCIQVIYINPKRIVVAGHAVVSIHKHTYRVRKSRSPLSSRRNRRSTCKHQPFKLSLDLSLGIHLLQLGGLQPLTTLGLLLKLLYCLDLLQQPSQPLHKHGSHAVVAPFCSDCVFS